MRTIFPKEIGDSPLARTNPAQISEESGKIPMKFPVVIKHRQIRAKIYGQKPGYPFYRISYQAAGKRRMQSFKKFSEAKAAAEQIVRDIANGSQAAALSPGQSRDALAAIERLESHYRATGQRVSLLAAVAEYAEACGKLAGRPLSEAVAGFLTTVATVQRKDVAEAVNEFLQSITARTIARDGQRAQLSAKYAYNREIQLKRFASTFQNTAVCDLTKDHLDTFIGSLKFSGKSRNHYRAALRQWLEWAVRKDYLPRNHRLLEADSMRPERANTSKTEFYTPAEFGRLLETVEGHMRAMIAIGGFAGLRTAELLRLDWAEVWNRPNYIEVTAGKSKTRQRRLVEICPALALWLEPFRTMHAGKLCPVHEITFQQHFVKLAKRANVTRKENGLRHAFCTYYFALTANENKTAEQAGNSPAIIHGHYKGLATKAEAESWFAVAPAHAANIIPLTSAK